MIGRIVSIAVERPTSHLLPSSAGSLKSTTQQGRDTMSWLFTVPRNVDCFNHEGTGLKFTVYSCDFECTEYIICLYSGLAQRVLRAAL